MDRLPEEKGPVGEEEGNASARWCELAGGSGGGHFIRRRDHGVNIQTAGR